MVSYYNTLAMFPNHPAHHHHPHPHRSAAHHAVTQHHHAAAAAAYFGYAGYAAPSPQHAFNMQTHHPHHHHHQFSAAAAVAAAAVAATGASPGPGGVGAALGDLPACSGGNLGLTASPGLGQDNPCTSPSGSSLQTLHHQHGSGFSQQQQQQQQFEQGGGGLGSPSPTAPTGWHAAPTPPPLYGSSCARHYDDWPSAPNSGPGQQQPPPLLGPPHSPGSPTGAYKFSSTLEFQQGLHQCPPPPPPPLQQPQDLSALGGGSGGGQHPSPDSGLAGSSDGVSSSAGSPQLLPHQVPHQVSHHQQQQGSQGGQGVRPPNPRSPYEWMKKPSYHSQPNPVGNLLNLDGGALQDLPGKTRTKDKYRVVYSDHQRLELEKEFHYSRYITIRRKSELAATLGLSERQVKIWFQNRRAKERKQVKKREEMIQKERLDVAVQMQHHEQQQQLAASGVVM